MRKIVRRFGERRRYTPNRIFQVIVLINTTCILVVFVLLSALWGFTGHGFMVFASSIFALAGIAFFAAWSILSNITAALVLFFHAPFGRSEERRVGKECRLGGSWGRGGNEVCAAQGGGS